MTCFPPASKAALPAAWSQPRAPPETTTIPASAAIRPAISAMARPYGVDRRAPTTDRHGAHNTVGSPRTYSLEGASCRSSRLVGYSASPRAISLPSSQALIAAPPLKLRSLENMLILHTLRFCYVSYGAGDAAQPHHSPAAQMRVGRQLQQHFTAVRIDIK